MHRKSGILMSSVSLSLAVLFLFACLPARSADPDTELGVKLFKQQKYVQAIKAFNRALKRSPKESGLYYFLGACYDQGGDRVSAKKLYGYAIQLSPSSESAQLAARALGKIDPAYLQSVVDAATRSPGNSSRHAVPAQRSSSSQHVGIVSTHSTPADLSSLPAESRVDFYRKPESGHLYLTAYVNNRPIEVMFDTGAEDCAFGKNHLQQLGIALPPGPPIGKAAGVGGEPVDVWAMNASVKVGQIERKNFPIGVQERMSGAPLLGQTFFRDFRYSIEASQSGTRGTIRFVRNDLIGGRSSTGSIYDRQTNRYEVPFHREGKEMVVQVEINGRPIPMIFDTGAHGVVLDREQMNQVGLSIPDNAEEGLSSGIAGTVKRFIFPVSRIKMGPIEKTNFQISILDQGKLPHPLMGQEFFQEWRYAIDNVHNVMKFKR
ncbi:MAG: aspartyl protease family protein [Candidatus Obscuribacterales bacterium]